MARMGFMASKGMGTGRGWICISSSPYPIKKFGYFPYLYLVNAGIVRQNKNEFENFSWGRFVCHP